MHTNEGNTYKQRVINMLERSILEAISKVSKWPSKGKKTIHEK
jgi:hypothetical protein